MLGILGPLLFWSLCFLILVQLILVIGVVGTLFRWRRPLLEDADCPKAAVILCLRGSDPYLTDCVEAILQQDYPDYDVRVIVDSVDDPAWAIVEEVVERLGSTHFRMEPLTHRRSTCSLKCSSILQAVSGLEESVDFISQLDADTIAHPFWLRELATALAPDDVGAATGNRWYMPRQISPGSMVRYFWNAAAIVQMIWYRIAWGGTLAIKTSLFRETDLLDRWGNAYCEDTMIHSALRRHGLRTAFVPSLMMVNRETCSLSNCCEWITRQLFSARLYHPGWPLVLGHGILTTLFPLLALVTFIIALATGDRTTASFAGLGLLAYEVSALLMVVAMEGAVRRIAKGRGEPTRWMGAGGGLLFLFALPLTQITYAFALAAAAVMRQVVWRGVHYRIDGPLKIKMISDIPEKNESHSDGDSL